MIAAAVRLALLTRLARPREDDRRQRRVRALERLDQAAGAARREIAGDRSHEQQRRRLTECAREGQDRAREHTRGGVRKDVAAHDLHRVAPTP